MEMGLMEWLFDVLMKLAIQESLLLFNRLSSWDRESGRLKNNGSIFHFQSSNSKFFGRV